MNSQCSIVSLAENLTALSRQVCMRFGEVLFRVAVIRRRHGISNEFASSLSLLEEVARPSGTAALRATRPPLHLRSSVPEFPDSEIVLFPLSVFSFYENRVFGPGIGRCCSYRLVAKFRVIITKSKEMSVLAFNIERDEESGMLVASWDDPAGGGITTQAESLSALTDAIKEAVRCHFADRVAPREVTLHFENDPVLQLA